MTTLRIILFVLGGISYMAVTFFACGAWNRLRRMERRQKDMFCNSTNALMLIMGQHLRSDLDQLSSMQHDLRNLVEREQYEAAEQLKSLIARQQKSISQSVENMRKQFGDAFKVVNTTIALHPNNDSDE